MNRVRISPAKSEQIRNELLVSNSAASLFRYGVMLFLSVVIAAVGLVQNSSAVVIGAMLIAPLLSPIMGVSLSLLRGSIPDIIKGLIVVIFSVAGSVLISFLIAWIFPQTSMTLNSEILARTSPDVRDLLVAFAAGAAGAYAICNTDASGAIPGVAISVALVPPLSATGVLLGRGQSHLAGGAFLLFLTNLFGILFTATLVFYLSGFVRVHTRHINTVKGALTSAAIFIPTLTLAIFLSIQFKHLAQDARELRNVTNVVSTWLGNLGELESINLENNLLEIRIASSNNPPSIEKLNMQLKNSLNQKMDVDLKWVPIEQDKIYRTSDSIKITSETRKEIKDWLDRQGLKLTSLKKIDGIWYVTTSGPIAPTNSPELVLKLKSLIGYSPTINISWIQSEPR